MSYLNKRFLLLIILFSLFVFKNTAQVDTLFFYFGKSKSPIPFVAISSNKKTYFSDIRGCVYLPKNEKLKIFVSHPLFNDTLISVPKQQIELSFNNKKFDQNSVSDSKATEIIQSLYFNRKSLSPSFYAPYFYETYNKYTITSDSIEIANKLISKISKKWNTKINALDSLDRHFFLSESVTERRYQNKNLQDEKIIATKISGIEKPLLSTVNSQIQFFSTYENFIKVLGKDYLNPIHKKGANRFYVSVFKTYSSKEDTIYLIHFTPKRKLANEAISGFYWYSSHHKTILYSIYQPYDLKSSLVSLICQSNTEIKDNIFFPNQNMTLVYAKNIGLGKHKTNVISLIQNFIYNINIDTTFNKESFSDISIIFNQDLLLDNEDFWKSKRKTSLSEKDRNTYTFFADTNTYLKFDNHIVLVEKLYSKEIPVDKVVFDLKESFIINDYERLRLGIRAYTSKKASEIISGGIYLGYGIRDTDLKYRVNLDISPHSKQKFVFQLNFFRKLVETGGLDIPFSTIQYSSESLRKIGIYRMERLEGIELSTEFEPLKYARTRATISKFQGISSQSYLYKNEVITRESYQEISLHTHYAYGKHYFKIIDKELPFKSTYPEFWFTFSKQIPENSSKFNYLTVDFRAEFSLRLMGIGFMKFRFGTGFRDGNIPLWKLYNGTGSKGFLSVTYNSFETMNFYEFMSDKYVTFFVTHDVGNLNLTRIIKPRLVLALNTGIGSLNHKSYYSMIDFKTMEKGFLETGFMINDILYQNFGLLKMTLGVGFYERLGSYRFEKNLNNSIFKFVFKFVL